MRGRGPLKGPQLDKNEESQEEEKKEEEDEAKEVKPKRQPKKRSQSSLGDAKNKGLSRKEFDSDLEREETKGEDGDEERNEGENSEEDSHRKKINELKRQQLEFLKQQQKI